MYGFGVSLSKKPDQRYVYIGLAAFTCKNLCEISSFFNCCCQKCSTFPTTRAI